MELIIMLTAGLAVGYVLGARKSGRRNDENVYKKEYGRTNGLYEPVRRD